VDSFSSRSPSDWFDRVERAREEPGDAYEVSGDELPHPGIYSAPVHMSLGFHSHELRECQRVDGGLLRALGGSVLVPILFPLFQNERVQAGHGGWKGTEKTKVRGQVLDKMSKTLGFHGGDGVRPSLGLPVLVS
jgi:hypothetical protein